METKIMETISDTAKELFNNGTYFLAERLSLPVYADNKAHADKGYTAVIILKSKDGYQYVAKEDGIYNGKNYKIISVYKDDNGIVSLTIIAEESDFDCKEGEAFFVIKKYPTIKVMDKRTMKVVGE